MYLSNLWRKITEKMADYDDLKMNKCEKNNISLTKLIHN